MIPLDHPWLILAAAGTTATIAAAIPTTIWLRRMTPERRANLAENTLVGFFVAVVAGLIMQGLVGFARDDMGLTGPWPYLLFFALDGMAAYFGLVAYRLAKQGARAVGPRLMVLAIVAGSAWFQWAHADGPLAARVAWAVLPLIAGYLWETVLKYRRRAWQTHHAPTPRTERIPRARWLLAPVQSLLMWRRMVLWDTTSYEEALTLHTLRVESIRRLRRSHGPWWAHKVPANIAVRLRKGFRIREAAADVDALLTSRELEIADVFADLQQPAEASPSDLVITDMDMIKVTPEPEPATEPPTPDPVPAGDLPGFEDIPLLTDTDFEEIAQYITEHGQASQRRPGRKSHPGRKGHPPEVRAEALRLHREGMSGEAIAREIDVPANTVRRWLRELNNQ